MLCSSFRTDPSWRVVLPPKCLERPTVDLGDVDPSNEQQLHKAFKSNASGVQVGKGQSSSSECYLLPVINSG